jgi:hypothetical protein
MSSGTSLVDYSQSPIYRGILTGLTDAFVIDEATRERMIAEDPASTALIKPFSQGTHLRPWYIETTNQYLITIPSSANVNWPWSEAADEAEDVFARHYPAISDHLCGFRKRATKRSDKGTYWWELRACAYWDAFNKPKIAWPDISKLPRFSMDTGQKHLGNTAYMIPTGDFFVLGILSSWATWFFISKTAQPLRLRGDRWQYRLFTQFMEQIPIPGGPEADKAPVADLARRCTEIGTARYELQSNVQNRLITAFGLSDDGQPKGKLNQKAQAWWELSDVQLGAALKTSFKLRSNPLKNPRTADEWEPYLAEKRAEVARLTGELSDAEAELNDRVFALFHLTQDEIDLLMREVEH